MLSALVKLRPDSSSKISADHIPRLHRPKLGRSVPHSGSKYLPNPLISHIRLKHRWHKLFFCLLLPHRPCLWGSFSQCGSGCPCSSNGPSLQFRSTGLFSRGSSNTHGNPSLSPSKNASQGQACSRAFRKQRAHNCPRCRTVPHIRPSWGLNSPRQASNRYSGSLQAQSGDHPLRARSLVSRSS